MADETGCLHLEPVGREPLDAEDGGTARGDIRLRVKIADPRLQVPERGNQAAVEDLDIRVFR